MNFNKAAEQNVILIGMPGTGKSTLGPLLANKTGKSYIDTDEVIKNIEGKELKDIVNEKGYEAFLDIQEKILLNLEIKNYIIATGGSVVYSNPVMRHLKDSGKVIYLKNSYKEIERRLGPNRRLARNGSQTLRELFDERTPLYEKYADIAVDCSEKSTDEIVEEILYKIS